MRQYLDDFGYLDRKHLFNTETVNIFCDASYRSHKHVSSYGALAVYNNNIIYKDIRPYQTSGETINSLELRGIGKAVALAFSLNYIVNNITRDNRIIPYVNIFSDSKYAVTALKSYLFRPIDWVWDGNRNVYTRRATTNRLTPVPNQDLIIEISNMIINFRNIHPYTSLDIWWCPAHINANSDTELTDAEDRFVMNNCSKYREDTTQVDDSFMRYVCDSNAKIDSEVTTASKSIRSLKQHIKEPINFIHRPKGV